MQIKSVRLKNVKSYVDETIHFGPGINFIHGSNGTGKTTLIESIGFALFDKLPYKPISGLVRNGRNRALIELLFTAPDGRDYLVIREFDGRHVISWRVRDAEFGEDVDLHGQADMAEWLRRTLGLDRSTALADLFDEVLGVQQGTFSAPFLDTPRDRKTRFDALLKVDGYRQAFTRTADARATLTEQLQRLDKDIAINKERVREMPEVRSKLSEARELENRLCGVVKKYDDELALRKGEYDRLANLRAQLELAEKELARHRTSLEALKDRLTSLAADLKSAREAQSICEDSEAGYREYVRLEQEIANLEKKLAERETLERTINEQEREILGLRAALQAEEENLSTRRAEVEGDLSEAVLRETELRVPAEKARTALEELAVLDRGLRQWAEARTDLERIYRDRQNQLARLGQKVDQLNGDLPEIRELARNLGGLDDLRARMARLPDVQEESRAAREQVAGAAQRLETLRGNSERLQGGKCPILGQDCQNVGGDLGGYFQALISSAEDELLDLKKKADLLEKEEEEIRRDQNRLTELENQNRQHRKLLGRLADGSREVSLTLRGLWPSDVRKKLGALMDSARDVCTAPVVGLDPADGLRQGANVLAGLEGAAVEVVLGEGTEECLRRVAGEVTAHAAVAESLRAFLDSVAHLHQSAGDAVQREKVKRSEAAATTATALAAETEKVKKLRSEMATLGVRAEKLKGRHVERARRESDLAKLQERLALFDGVKEALVVAKGAQALHKTSHEAYLQNVRAASRVSSLVADEGNVRQAIATAEAEVATLEASAADLRGQFDPTAFEAVGEDISRMREERAARASELAATSNEAEELSRRLDLMTRIEAETERLSAQFRRKQEVASVLEFIRSCLNRAGEPIAEIFRQEIAAEADRIHRRISGDPAQLLWESDYEIALEDRPGGQPRRRTFRQLSGGEQMTAALAVRLALLRQLSSLGVGFFDEPTSNLDGNRRVNLAGMLGRMAGEIEQLFLISHDDTFDAITENVTRLQKREGEGSRMVVEG